MCLCLRAFSNVRSSGVHRLTGDKDLRFAGRTVSQPAGSCAAVSSIGEIVNFRILSATAFAAIFALVRPSPAAADFTVCNSTTDGTVNVAWAVTWLESDGDFNGESHGWWPVGQNECKTIIGADISA